MKYIKYIIRIIIISPFILGIPLGIKCWNGTSPDEMIGIDAILACAGMLSCVVIALAIIGIIYGICFTIVMWVFN